MTVTLREPDLPRTAKVRTGPLRTGWTTGACAAAAAKAAAQLLAGAHRVAEVEIGLPEPFEGRDRVSFDVERAERVGEEAEAVVVKDAGDDPDVTHGAHVTVRLARTPGAGVVFAAGEGVGTVTKPGLGLEVGGPAINPVPRAMITTAVGEVLDLSASGVRCTVSVPGGERMARKTTNARLGILGGISILGTTGVVRPFSTASWLASVEQAIDVLAAQGLDTVVLSTGGRTERAARTLLPALPEVCFVEVGDFTGAALRRASANGVAKVVFVGMAGKLAKLAGGVLMTHYTRSRVDLDLLADLTGQAGAEPGLVAEVRAANTARHAYEVWRHAGLDRAADLLCARVARVLAEFGEGALAVEVYLVDFDSLEVVGHAA
jgi:cobalt-precorrin-5B (C1)-methyltransferase